MTIRYIFHRHRCAEGPREASMQPQRRTPVTSVGLDTVPWEDRILDALKGLQFGAVEITVHEGKVVQIERREKLRFPSQTTGKT